MMAVTLQITIDEDAANAISTLLNNMSSNDYEKLTQSSLHEHVLMDLRSELDKFKWHSGK